MTLGDLFVSTSSTDPVAIEDQEYYRYFSKFSPCLSQSLTYILAVSTMSHLSDIRRDRTSRNSAASDIQCDRILDALDDFIQSFWVRKPCRRPGFYGRFAHIDLPPYRLERLMINMYESFAVSKSDRIFFIVSEAEMAMFPPDMVEVEGIPPPVVLTFAQFLGVLRANWVEMTGRNAGWKTAAQPEGWDNGRVLPPNAIFVMQLDYSMPAECSLSLVGLVQWAIHNAITPDQATRVLTMSADSNCDILARLVELQEPTSEVTYLDLYQLVEEDFSDVVTCHTTEERLASDVANAFQEHMDEPQVILSFLRGHIEDQLEGLTATSDGIRMETFELQTPKSIMKLKQFQRYNENVPLSLLVFADVNSSLLLPFAFEGYAHIHVILNPCHSRHLAWDDDAGQLVQSYGDCSVEERQRQIWWAIQPRCKRVSVYTFQDNIDSFSEVGGPDDRQIEGVQLGGFIASLYDLQSFGISARNILPVFIRKRSRAAQMLDRLQVQGIVSRERFALVGSTAAIFRSVLPACNYDHRIALLLAFDCDHAVRRVRIQLAALLLGDINHLLQLKPASLSDDSAVKTRLLDMCSGAASSLARQGTIWMTLGLWRFCHQVKYNGTRNLLEQEAEKFLSFAERPTCEVEDRFIQLGEALKLSGAFTEEEGKQLARPPAQELHQLDDIELHELQRGLLRAFVHQLALGHRPSNANGGDATMIHEVISTVLPLGEIKQPRKLVRFVDMHDFLAQEHSAAIFGICTGFVRPNFCPSVFATGWTWIPARVVAEWKQEHAPQLTLSDALSSE